MKQFIQKYNSDVTGSIATFDRLVFRGSLRNLSYAEGMMGYLWAMKVLPKDFGSFVQEKSNQLKVATLEYAKQRYREIVYLPSSRTCKEEEARKVASNNHIQNGLITILSCVEPCRFFDIFRNRETKKLELVSRIRKCLHYYHYYIHPVFGFMNARIQTWFPFNIQICINGREWLAKEMDKVELSYIRKENCFTWLEDQVKTKMLIQKQLATSWANLLNEIASQLNPIHHQIFHRYPPSYYWTVHQSEWATDIMFRSPKALDKLYSSLIRFGIINFSSADVMRFLGKKVRLGGNIPDGNVPGTFKKELTSDIKCRPEGVRIKHSLNKNSVKMYNKQGSVLRVETTINNPKDFKIYRSKQDGNINKEEWLPMRKGIADMLCRMETSDATNNRYLDAIAQAQKNTPLDEISKPICCHTYWNEKRVRALRPFSKEDTELMDAVSAGEFLINGFRNRDILSKLFFQEEISTPAQKKRVSAVVTRKIRLLRAHGILKKIPKTHRYFVTENGRELISAFQIARYSDVNSLLKLVA